MNTEKKADFFMRMSWLLSAFYKKHGITAKQCAKIQMIDVENNSSGPNSFYELFELKKDFADKLSKQSKEDYMVITTAIRSLLSTTLTPQQLRQMNVLYKKYQSYGLRSELTGEIK